MRNIHAAIQSALEIESSPISVPPRHLPALRGKSNPHPRNALVAPVIPAVVYLQEGRI